jgi:glutamine synthetase
MNWETGYGDWIASPVWDTLRVLPWLEKTALVLSDTIDEETHGIPVSPRTILKRQVALAAERGFGQGRFEFEYYVLRDSWDDMARKGFVPPGASAPTTRTITCSRRRRLSRCIGCCAIR